MAESCQSDSIMSNGGGGITRGSVAMYTSSILQNIPVPSIMK